MAKIIVQDTEITVSKVNGEDYICITDMLKAKDGDFFVTDWLRNRNTMEFLGVWERIYNPNFNYGEFATIRNQAGLNSFKISVKEFVARTGAISLQAKAGRYGGTYAHKDIAFEFASWISAEIKLYIIKEFQRLKKNEAYQNKIDWHANRVLAKANYLVHTDAIKNFIVPTLTEKQKKFVYASEADVLNVALFGMTAKEWRTNNPDIADKGNIRDYTDLLHLIILNNLENINAELIEIGMSQSQRLIKLNKMAKRQMELLKNNKSFDNLEYIEYNVNKNEILTLQ